MEPAALQRADDIAVLPARRAVPGLTSFYRYGSSVADAMRADGDLDDSLLCEAPVDSRASAALREPITLGVGRDVDLVDLRRVSTDLRMEVVAREVAFHDVDRDARASYEDFVFKDYARLGEETALIVARLRRMTRFRKVAVHKCSALDLSRVLDAVKVGVGDPLGAAAPFIRLAG